LSRSALANLDPPSSTTTKISYIQTDFDVAETLSINQLRKRHGAKLLGARERAHTIVAIITIIQG
jgi:hypothetical protein